LLLSIWLEYWQFSDRTTQGKMRTLSTSSLIAQKNGFSINIHPIAIASHRRSTILKYHKQEICIGMIGDKINLPDLLQGLLYKV